MLWYTHACSTNLEAFAVPRSGEIRTTSWMPAVSNCIMNILRPRPEWLNAPGLIGASYTGPQLVHVRSSKNLHIGSMKKNKNKKSILHYLQGYVCAWIKRCAFLGRNMTHCRSQQSSVVFAPIPLDPMIASPVLCCMLFLWSMADCYYPIYHIVRLRMCCGIPDTTRLGPSGKKIDG